ncbi:MAG: CHAT domain-containing protein [Cyanobacteriota bacterium]|nr:CHAT domain-containing protein [Cyanobacteriota bacterium]
MRAKQTSLSQKIRSSIVLGLLTLFLVTTVSPVTARESDRSASLSSPIEVGKQSYFAGQISAAVRDWQRAAQTYEDRGDRLNYALAQNYLSLAYQDLNQWQEARSAIARSLETLREFPEDETTVAALLAQSFNFQGSLELATGQVESALESWMQAEAAYERAGDIAGVIGSQIDRAQALQTLGQYLRAKDLLEQVNATLASEPDSQLKAHGLRSLGTTLGAIGDLDRAQKILEQSLAISEALQEMPEVRATLFSLGNTARDRNDYRNALIYYKQATELSETPVERVELLLNQLNLLVSVEQWNTALGLLPVIDEIVKDLPPSRMSANARVNFAESLMRIGTVSNTSEPLVANDRQIANLLAEAIQEAKDLQDWRAQSYALGKLGQLYEIGNDWSSAQQLTQQALAIAQRMNSADLAYRWHWQLGRVLKAKGERTGAIASYSEAVKRLQSLRRDLVAIDTDLQFSFRDRVEPVYRQLVDLLLGPDSTQDDLIEAREAIETLQLAELDNFFREDCLRTKAIQIDEIDPHAAVIYPIVLPDRIEVVLSLPNRDLRHYSTSLPSSEVEEVLQTLFESLHLAYSTQKRLALSEQVYDWLIRPAQEDLEAARIETLVFVPEGFLRNLPMSALYDGEHYLIEKYRVAISPGLQLLGARSLEQTELSALAGGLTEARQGFVALPAVADEVTKLERELSAEVFLNEAFTRDNLQNQISNFTFDIVHLATHAQFSSSAEETFLLTWNDRVNVKEFGEVLQRREGRTSKPIELLVLSACQTAEGDDRATLGLAGLAVRSGARSTLASLWAVRDESTAQLMKEFYQQLREQPGIGRAEALRKAQLSLISQPDFNHPFFWSPFVLIGNWL